MLTDKAGDRSYVNIYKHILVLAAVSKTVEEILCNTLIQCLDKFKIISQFGFSKGTEDVLSILTSLITEHLDTGNKMHIRFSGSTKSF